MSVSSWANVHGCRGTDRFVLAMPAVGLPPSEAVIDAFSVVSWRSPIFCIGEIRSTSCCISLSPSLLGVDAFILLLFLSSVAQVSAGGLLFLSDVFDLQEVDSLDLKFDDFTFDIT